MAGPSKGPDRHRKVKTQNREDWALQTPGTVKLWESPGRAGGLPGLNYRILYFFHGRHVAILVHALTKEGAISAADIERALGRKATFEHDPERHTYAEEAHEGDNHERPEDS